MIKKSDTVPEPVSLSQCLTTSSSPESPKAIPSFPLEPFAKFELSNTRQDSDRHAFYSDRGRLDKRNLSASRLLATRLKKPLKHRGPGVAAISSLAQDLARGAKKSNFTVMQSLINPNNSHVGEGSRSLPAKSGQLVASVCPPLLPSPVLPLPTSRPKHQKPNPRKWIHQTFLTRCWTMVNVQKRKIHPWNSLLTRILLPPPSSSSKENLTDGSPPESVENTNTRQRTDPRLLSMYFLPVVVSCILFKSEKF